MKKKRILISIALCVSILVAFACSQTKKSETKISGVWLTEEGASSLREVISSINFGEDSKATVLTNANGQVVFSSDPNKSIGFKVISSDVIVFLLPGDGVILEMFAVINYKFENDKFVLSYNGQEIIAAKYELGSKFTIFLDNGKSIVLSK